MTNKKISKKTRKIVQIAISNAMCEYAKLETIIALCNDGTLWQRSIEIDAVKVYGGNGLEFKLFHKIKENT